MPRKMRKIRLLPLLLTAMLAMSGCAGAGALGAGGQALVIAIVSNPQMKDAIALSNRFEADHPGIDLKFVSLPENQARAKITASTATQGGEFDVVMISNYETPQWARNGWLVNLEPYIKRTEGYDTDDFIPSIRDSLSYEGSMYSVPFYGESSFLAYRKDLFAKAGLTMPKQPTWQQVAEFAKKLHDPAKGISGICLRGKPGWGENLAPLSTVVNTFGGRWFDMDWNARLTAPGFREAVKFYVNLVRDYGEVGASTAGFSTCGTRYAQGQAAMWYDATVMAGTNESPQDSRVVGKSGYVAAPVNKTEAGGWLYTWSLGMPKSTENKQAAWDFMSWVTSKKYAKLVGETLGWNSVPPGVRKSTYRIPQYREAAQAYAQETLDAIASASQEKAMTKPVPYYGLQFVGIPEFQDLGTRVSQQISAAIAGQIPVDEALERSQRYAETVGKSYQEER
ncbi:MAG: ABC transporter substrate-binding protein [Haloechinothrix sp.]